MKKISLVLALLFTVNLCFTQEDAESYPRNEVNLNIANTIIIASVEVGYQRFLDYNQAIGLSVLINDRINYHSEKGDRAFKTNSVKLDYTFYFDSYKSGAGFYAQPFLKYRFGTFNEKTADVFGDRTIPKKTDMDSFMIGIGMGYKWNFSDRFVIGPFVNVARNFSDDVRKRFSSVEFNAGLIVGLRF